jgi:hypothetical protein
VQQSVWCRQRGIEPKQIMLLTPDEFTDSNIAQVG